MRGTKKAESEYKRSLLTTIKSAAMSRAQYWTAATWLLGRKHPMEYGKMERKVDDDDNVGDVVLPDSRIRGISRVRNGVDWGGSRIRGGSCGARGSRRSGSCWRSRYIRPTR